ncbi:unnamed protein product [Withania somnifera]
MTTLERSSYSFRRQGSSGHIWDNRLSKPARGETPAATVHGIENSQQQRSIQLDKVSDVATKSVVMKSNKNAYAVTPTSGSESKAHKCSFIAIFGRCAKTPAS